MATKSFSIKKDPFVGSRRNNIISTEKYESIFDYEKFEIIDLKEELVESEERIIRNLTNIGKSTFEIAEELYSVNKKMANRGNGIYMAWCSSLGINKDRSSVLIKKYSLYLETNKKEIMELPIPIVKTLTSKNSSFTQKDIIEIVEDKKPSEKIKEIEKRYSQLANKKSCEIIEAEIIEIESEKIERLKKEARLYRQEAKEFRNRAVELDKKADDIERELEGLNIIKKS